MIVIDTREPDEIAEYIKEEAEGTGIEIKEEHLDTGDFLAGDYIIERKRYGDFIGRMTQSERDIWQQVLAMESAADDLGYTPVLLFEGEWAEALRWSDMTPKEVTKAIASVMKLGVFTTHVVGPRACAQLMVKLADDSTHDIGSIRDSPSVPPEMIAQHIVEGAPGVGPSRAKDLLRQFGTPIDVFSASVDELTEVSGIGDATAEKIVDAGQSELPED